MTHTEILGCVCVLAKFYNAHPLFHGLRIPIHTVHVQMKFFTPLHVVQTHSQHTLSRTRNTYLTTASEIGLYEKLSCDALRKFWLTLIHI